MAMRKPPRLNGPSLPSSVRVPSGMMPKENPGRSRIQAAAWRRLSTARSVFLRSMGNMPMRRMVPP